jgi:hypothetical protein
MYKEEKPRGLKWLGLADELARSRPSAPTYRRLRALRRFLFVACAPGDEERARPMLDMIERSGHILWVDHRHLPNGPSRAKDTSAVLRRAKAMLVCCSDNLYRSRTAHRELAMVWRLNKPIAPILLDDAPMPDTFSFYLDGLPAIRLSDRYWKARLHTAMEHISRGARRWPPSPPVETECAPVLVLR